MERDVIGEVMNISLGSSATSLSSLLSKRVEITVPKINVTAAEEFSYKQLEPAIGVEINYIEGLKGVNIMIWKRSDAKIILEALLNKKMTDEEFEMDEISISAICEVMNQMMGSSATALSDFLGKHINISTPVAFEIDDNNEFKGKYFV
ncbi:MAG: chemotaxis protein CheC [Tissierellia bacterium]|nr:chemotaxis protein CheC [Tissierellia bacterium]